jgi:hypothetical protein
LNPPDRSPLRFLGLTLSTHQTSIMLHMDDVASRARDCRVPRKLSLFLTR